MQTNTWVMPIVEIVRIFYCLFYDLFFKHFPSKQLRPFLVKILRWNFRPRYVKRSKTNPNISINVVCCVGSVEIQIEI